MLTETDREEISRGIDVDPELRQRVVDKLRAGGSPDQLAGRLRDEHPGRQACWVSHAASYTWIYALPTGELSRLGILLRSGRTQCGHGAVGAALVSMGVGMRPALTPALPRSLTVLCLATGKGAS